MQSVLDKSSVEIKYNVTDRIASWGQLKYYPVINVKRNYNSNSLNISVENFDTDIWIYMNVTTQTHFNLKKYLPAIWLAPHISYHILNIDFINKNDWVLVNLQQTGKYNRKIYYTLIFISIFLLLYLNFIYKNPRPITNFILRKYYLE